MRHVSTTPDQSTTDGRLSAAARREALLDAARELVADGGPAAATMGTVAARAGVTRALVYKHFSDRGDVLAALYRREASALDAKLRTEVLAAPDGFEGKLRAFVRGSIRSAGAREFFAPLRGFGLDEEQRRTYRTWNRQTLEFFVELAVAEFDLDAGVARPALTALLPGVLTLVTSERRPAAARRRFLEDLSVELVVGALDRLRDGGLTPPRPASRAGARRAGRSSRRS